MRTAQRSGDLARQSEPADARGLRIELWEDPITRQMQTAGVTTMLVSDHPHLFETGGENYHTDFTAWEYLRGSDVAHHA